MKFLADMGISRRSVEFLPRLGHEATHLVEPGLERMEDDEILAKARDEDWGSLGSNLGFYKWGARQL